ncbi:hypothetical protein E1263_37030 [Kribbella antibiotica]|uniref:Uncharacterized protein n=1 Tax=Kribbella antibiotica TaxID=190195 RepID=A0A4R4YME0_9ACTN|nr:hypothetical protein [Kribbella antibiotica]TDD46218.1 hypothetical protein E1263_37030 [Kribbella antibiotica]
MRERLRRALWDLGWGGRGTGVMFLLAGIGAVLGGCVGALFDDWLMGSGFGMLAGFGVFIGLVVWAHRGHMNPDRKH